MNTKSGQWYEKENLLLPKSRNDNADTENIILDRMQISSLISLRNEVQAGIA